MKFVILVSIMLLLSTFVHGLKCYVCNVDDNNGADLETCQNAHTKHLMTCTISREGTCATEFRNSEVVSRGCQSIKYLGHPFYFDKCNGRIAGEIVESELICTCKTDGCNNDKIVDYHFKQVKNSGFKISVNVCFSNVEIILSVALAMLIFDLVNN